MSTQPTDSPSGADPHDHRFARRSGWVGGAVLITLGILLLLRNLNLATLPLNNWWALFILIPAAGAFSRAWGAYQAAGGRLTDQARSALFGGVILSLITAMFLFGLSWGVFGPALLMLVGVSVLVGSLART